MIELLIGILIGLIIGWCAGVFIDGKIDNLQDEFTYGKYRKYLE